MKTRDLESALEVLERLTEKVERANAIQHSRPSHTIPAEDWAELYDLCAQARLAISLAEQARKRETLSCGCRWQDRDLCQHGNAPLA